MSHCHLSRKYGPAWFISFRSCLLSSLGSNWLIDTNLTQHSGTWHEVTYATNLSVTLRASYYLNFFLILMILYYSVFQLWSPKPDIFCGRLLPWWFVQLFSCVTEICVKLQCSDWEPFSQGSQLLTIFLYRLVTTFCCRTLAATQCGPALL